MSTLLENEKKRIPVSSFVKHLSRYRKAVPLSLFIRQYHGEKELKQKNPSLDTADEAAVVRYLTRWIITDAPVMLAFSQAILAAYLVYARSSGYEEAFFYTDLLKACPDKLSDEAIILATKLTGYEVVRRKGTGNFQGVSHIYPDAQTVKHIREMVRRSVSHLEAVGATDTQVVLAGQDTEEGLYGVVDYVSHDTIWAVTTSRRADPSTEDRLAMLVCLLMLRHENRYPDRDITKIGFYNPRFSLALILDINSLEPGMVDNLTKSIYGRATTHV